VDYKGEFVRQSILSCIAAVRVFFRSRSDTALEVLALRLAIGTEVISFKQSSPMREARDNRFPRWLKRESEIVGAVIE
jgi:hypothetical protein